LENIRKYSRMGEETWKDKEAKGVNPCAEQALESYELCCLSETFPSRHESWEEFKETLKYAYLYAKTVTLITTRWKQTNAVMLKNRRIGVSQSGIVQAFQRHGRRTMLEWSDKGYNYLREVDEEYSKWLCIPKSIKLTTVKPSGTVSLLPGVTSGIHYPYGKYYIRRIRLSKDSELINILLEAGYNLMVDKYSPNTVVVEFPIKLDDIERSRFDVPIWEKVMNAVDYQKYWSDNQVSITVTYREEEKDQIKRVLECFEDKLKVISFLPLKDHGYDLTPYEQIDKSKYIEMKKNLRELDFNPFKGEAEGEEYCNGIRCKIE
jgi:adenosylcobalamin-dependent ribonucleoside-triphosphate reductase